MEPKKVPKKAACDVKAKLIKLEGGSAAFQLYFIDFYGYKTGSLFLSLYAPRYCLAASAGFGRQFAKLRALSRLRRRYD